MAEKWHSGINMHKLTVGAGFEGLLFAIGCSLIFVFGLPALWYFVAFSAALGVGIAIFLRAVNNRRSDHLKPLSILQADEKETRAVAQQQDRSRNLFHAKPGFCAP
jgi:hypothetical protein